MAKRYISHWIVVELLIHLTRVNDNFPTPQWGFEVIIAAVQSLSPSKSPRYRYVDSVAGHLLSQLLSHFPLFSSSSSSLFSLQRFYLLLLLSLSFCLIVLPSHLPLLATVVVGHGGTWLCVRSCVIDHTHTHTHTQKHTLYTRNLIQWECNCRKAHSANFVWLLSIYHYISFLKPNYYYISTT